MRKDFFTAPGGDVEAQVRPIAEGLEQMGAILPASLQADTESYYAKTEGRSVKETQQELLKRTSFVMVLARAIGWNGGPLSRDVVVAIHEGIFGPVFGSATLGLRSPPRRHELRDDDGVEFPIWIVTGAGRPPEIRTRHGVRSKQVRRRLDEACEAFESEAQGLVNDLDGGALAIAKLYVRIIRIHPFGDGNGRTAWGAVQYAAGRLRLPFVQSSPTTEARVALGDTIRHGERIQPLANEIRQAMWPAS